MSEENVNTPIAALGEENLLEIFQYLDGEILKTCSLVCKEWDKIIGNSSKTMCKLPLMIRNFRRSSYFLEEMEIEILDLRRRYRTIIFNNSEIDETLANVLNKFAFNIRVLKFESSSVTREIFTSILNSSKKLDHLYIIHSTIRTEGDRAICSLASIKSLTIVNLSFDFVNLFKNTQVRDLKIAFRTHKTLTPLATMVLSDLFIFYLERFTRNNRLMLLTKLAIDFKYFDGCPQANNDFVRFLERSLSLQCLELTSKIPEEILECVVKKLKISTLFIDADHLPVEPEFYDQMEPNHYLKTLVIRKLDNLHAAQRFNQLYPSIEKLVIENHDRHHFKGIFVYLPRIIKNHFVDQLRRNTPAVTISSIKTFSIQEVVGNELQAFCLNNPSIENLIVQEAVGRTELTYEVINTITRSLTNLKYLYFGRCLKPSKRILEMLARNCRNLQLLELFDDGENLSQTFVGALNFRIQYHRQETESQLIENVPSMWHSEIDIFERRILDIRHLQDEGTDYFSGYTICSGYIMMIVASVMVFKAK